ncbi:MAG: DUF3078 domain-containing protein [Bacteroidota bacterium]|nr:DUF3078 domain-containing protein [Bacteroidota bacterium]
MKSILSSILFLSFLVVNTSSFAQDKTVKEMQSEVAKDIKKHEVDSGKVWKTGGQFDLNLAQGSQSNWAAGGDDFSFSVNSYFGLYAFYKKEKYSWDNTLDLNYGLVNTTSLGSRKNDDRINFLTKAGYEIAPKLSLSALFNFRSQFSKGYNYNKDGTKDLLSNFLAPAYILLSLGLDYKPADGLSIFVSPITSRWTIVRDDSLSAKGAYGVVPGKKSYNEIGAFVTVNYLKNLSKTITYKGRLDLFSNYEKNPQNVDVLMNNMFTAKVSKVLTASLGLDLIYDDNVKLFGPNHDSPALQLKSQIAVGMSVKF